VVEDVHQFLHNPTLVMFRKTEQDGDAEFMDAFKQVATQNKYRAKFAYSDIEGDDMENILKEMMGVTEEDLPTLRAYNPEGNKKYKCETGGRDLTAGKISEFMEDFLADKIPQVYKSEEIPESNNDTVKVVVGKTWEEVVMDPSKDVFIMYYAPWCKYSKEMQLPWLELAQMMSSKSNMVVAKMDGNANEAPGLFVKHFPTLVYYPRSNKEGIVFQDTESDVNTQFLYHWLMEAEELD
jgi:protein disulfide-isomerase A1